MRGRKSWTPPLTCRGFLQFLDDYLSGELPREQRAAVEAHLADCPTCDQYTGSYLGAMRAAKAALAPGDVPIPENVPEALVSAILATSRRILVTPGAFRHPTCR